MAAAMQAKLLRVLETRIVERVGGMLPIPVDVRELKNVVDRAQANCAGVVVTAERLAHLLRPSGAADFRAHPPARRPASSPSPPQAGAT